MIKERCVIDNGPVKHFLGMEVNRNGKTGSISIAQKKHIRKFLNDFGKLAERLLFEC